MVVSFDGGDLIGRRPHARLLGRMQGSSGDLHWGSRTGKFYSRDPRRMGMDELEMGDLGPARHAGAPVLKRVGDGMFLDDEGMHLLLTPCGGPGGIKVIKNEKVQVPYDRGKVMEIDIATGCRRMVTEVDGREPVQEWFLTCSGDGRFIAYDDKRPTPPGVDEDKGEWDIRIENACDPADRAWLGLPAKRLNLANPVWSPDSQYLACQRAPRGETYIVELAGR